MPVGAKGEERSGIEKKDLTLKRNEEGIKRN